MEESNELSFVDYCVLMDISYEIAQIINSIKIKDTGE